MAMHDDDTNCKHGQTVQQQLDDLRSQIHLLTTAQLMAPPPIPPKCNRSSSTLASTFNATSGSTFGTSGPIPKPKAETVYPFDTMISKEEHSTQQYTLPESIYSGAMIFPLSGPWSRLSRARACFLFCIPLLNYVLVLAGCLFVQFTFVIYVGSNLSNITNAVCTAQPKLVYVGLIAFFVSVIGDFHQSIHMMQWLWHIPRSDQLETLQYTVVPSVGDKEECVVFKHGLPRWYKLLWCLPICISKMVLAFLVLLYGSHFVSTSENDLEVILNCVALCFIFELDEYAYHFFTDKASRKVVSELPPVVVQSSRHDDRMKMCGLCCGPAFAAGGILCMAYFSYKISCQPYFDALEGLAKNVSNSSGSFGSR